MFEHLMINWQFFAAFGLIAIVSYLIGSVNFAIITTKARLNKDIRDYGSGNAGMTNVLRTQGKSAAAVVFVGDFIKGAASAAIGFLIGWWLLGAESFRLGGYIGYFFVLMGHLFPVFYQFKGGKGILASAGAMVVLEPIVFAAILLTFAVVVLASRIVSLASICGAAMLPISMFILRLCQGSADLIFEAVFCLVVAALVIFMHRQNIVRLMNGTENRFGKKK